MPHRRELRADPTEVLGFDICHRAEDRPTGQHRLEARREPLSRRESCVYVVTLPDLVEQVIAHRHQTQPFAKIRNDAVDERSAWTQRLGSTNDALQHVTHPDTVRDTTRGRLRGTSASRATLPAVTLRTARIAAAAEGWSSIAWPPEKIDYAAVVAHVLARLNGFGVTLIPNWPYSFEREGHGSDVVHATRWTPSGPAQATIDPGNRVESNDVVDVADGFDIPYWLIETSIFSVRWPAGFTVNSPHDAGDDTPFYLQGPGEAIIFTQGPMPKARLSDPNALVAPGQSVLARRSDDNGVAGVELSYLHDDEQWWQAHWMMPCQANHVVVITAQSLLFASAATRMAAETVVATFEGSA